MNAIRRLLGEAEDCFAPVLVPSAAMLARQRRARPRFRGPTSSEEAEAPPTREAVVAELKGLGESLQAVPSMAPFSPLVLKLAEAISTNSLVPFDAVLTTSTTQQTNVVVQPKPPEQDPVLASILGKEPPEQKPSLEQAQRSQAQPQAGPSPAQAPSSQDVQRAMEAALSGTELKPKVELVESSGLSAARSLLQMGPVEGVEGVPLLGAPPTGASRQVWTAFKRFVKQ